MADAFATFSDNVMSPCRKLAAVTPSDTTDLANVPKALWVSVAGTLAIVAADDVSNAGAAMGSLAVGTVVPVRARRVLATGTSATVVALF